MDISLHQFQRSVEAKKNKLVSDLKGVAADADNLLRDVAEASTEEFAAGQTKERLRVARASLDQARALMVQKAGAVARNSQDYAREHPWKAVGIPALAAIAVFVLISRR